MERTNQQTLGQINTAVLTDEPDEGVRLAQGRFLDELPGAAFAGITLFWIVSSLASLIWREMPADMISHVQSLVHGLLGSHALMLMSRVGGAASFARTAYGFFDPRTPA